MSKTDISNWVGNIGTAIAILSLLAAAFGLYKFLTSRGGDQAGALQGIEFLIVGILVAAAITGFTNIIKGYVNSLNLGISIIHTVFLS